MKHSLVRQLYNKSCLPKACNLSVDIRNMAIRFSGIALAFVYAMGKTLNFYTVVKIMVFVVVACQSAFGQTVNYDFYNQQQNYFTRNRTTSEKANPFQNPNLFNNPEEVEKFIGSISSERFKYKYDKSTNEVYVFDQSKNNELVSMLPMTTRADILSYKPSKFKEKLQLLSRDIYKSGKGGVRHTVVNLPMEVSIFYMAIGSVSAFNLFSNAGQNPAALKLFNDQQMSAVGMTSLFMFLASQNATSNITQLFIKNPKWQVMLPYLSMTVGTMTQNYATALMTDPNIKACVNEWFGPLYKVESANENPCDKAYEYFTLQKPWEFAPGLTSMIISTIAATTAQYGVSQGALALEKKITTQVIKNEIRRDIAKSVLLRFAGFVNPGSVPFIAMGGVWLYLTKASNLAFFAELDHSIYQGTTFAVKNLQESVSLPFVNSVKKTSDKLAEHILNQKQNKWSIERNSESCGKNKNGDCSGFYEELVKFQDQMKIWRMSNIAEVTETHHSWQTYLGDLVSRYMASKEFYGRFINEAKKYKVNPKNEENLLNRKYPLWGITTTKTKYFDETHFTDPHLPESEQLQLALEFKEEILKIFEARKLRAKILFGDDLITYDELKSNFLNNNGLLEVDKIRLGKGIITIQNWLNKQEAQGKNQYTDYKAIENLYKKLGKPSPQFEPGAGFILSIGRSLKLNEIYKNIDLGRDNSLTRSKYFNSFSDVILTNMICGPDAEKNELLIDTTWGFSSHFTSPRITNLLEVVKNGDRFCDNRLPLPLMQSEYSVPFIAPLGINSIARAATYISPFEFLKYNLKTSLYNESFDDWWVRNTDFQMATAFSDFQMKYTKNIVKLVKKLSQRENSVWNKSNTLANGVMINIFQELRVYLLILGEILKDHIAEQNKYADFKPLINQEESSRNIILPLTSDEKNIGVPEIVKYQSRGSFLDFYDILKQLNVGSKLQKNTNKIIFKFQKDMEKNFAELNGLLLKIKLLEDGNQTKIVGELDNTEFDSVIDGIEKLSVEIATLYGVSSPSDSSSLFVNEAVFPTLSKSDSPAIAKQAEVKIVSNDSTKQIVVKTLEYIQSLAYEVKTYGMIANAVNWKSINNLKVNSEVEAKRQQKVDQILKNIKTNAKVGG